MAGRRVRNRKSESLALALQKGVHAKHEGFGAENLGKKILLTKDFREENYKTRGMAHPFPGEDAGELGRALSATGEQ